MKRHYLDHNATAPVRPEVTAIVAQTMATVGNASSVHSEGRQMQAVLERARAQLCCLINAPANGVVFTSGGTESIHLAVNGARRLGVREIFISAIEHSAVAANADATGLPVRTAPVTPEGVVDLAALSEVLGARKAMDGAFLLCLMLANNETGVIQPVADVAALVREAGGYLFVDAAQAVGKIPVDFATLGADMMGLTGHKFGGPLGVGALALRPNLAIEPVMRGGGQEMNRRAGTHNVPGIVGLGQACALAGETLARAGDIAALRDRVEGALRQRQVRIWGATADRLPGTLCYSAPGFSAETQLMALDLAGVAVSSGSACSSGKVTPSHVLQAMGAAVEEAASAIRVSLGWNSTSEDVDAFINAWAPAYDRVKARAA